MHGKLRSNSNAIIKFQDEVIKFHKTQTAFTIIMIVLAIATTTAAISTVVLSHQTGQKLEHLRKINEAQFKINNNAPFALAESSSIYLDRNYTQIPKYSFEGIKVDPFSNHSLKIAVVNATIIDLKSNLFCMFEGIPKIRLFQGDSVFWKVGEEPKKLEPSLSVDYKIKNEHIVTKNSDVKPVRHSIATVVFELLIQDLQNNIITNDKAYSSLIVWIDHTEMSLTC